MNKFNIVITASIGMFAYIVFLVGVYYLISLVAERNFIVLDVSTWECSSINPDTGECGSYSLRNTNEN